MRRLAPALAALLLLAGCGSDGGESAGTVLKRASDKPARSADVDMTLELKLDGVERLKDPVRVTLSGPYRSNGAGRFPDFDFRIGYDASGRSGSLRLVGAEANAFVEYNGASYEVGRQLVDRLRAKSRAGSRPGTVDGSKWLKDGSVSDDGRTVKGDVDVARMLADVNRVIAKTPGGRPIPQATIDQLDQAVKDAALEVRLGPDDVLRSSSFDASFELSDELRSKARGLEGGELSFRYGQSNVNGTQRIEAPTGARPIAELLRGFGVPPEALLGPGVSPQGPG